MKHRVATSVVDGSWNNTVQDDTTNTYTFREDVLRLATQWDDLV